jgi:hypothetical protein
MVKTMRHNSALVLAAVLLAVTVSVVACSAEAPLPSPSPAPTGAGVLLTVETRGGLCANGPCGTTIFVERDGRVHQAAKPPNDLGVVSAGALAALERAIQSTDFAELRSHRFTGQCPTAYDGQEIVFEFGAPGGVERIASCETAVDYGSPLFVAILNAVGPFVALPTP